MVFDMKIKQAIQDSHARFAGTIDDAAAGFRFATDAGDLTFTDVGDRGQPWT